ncbi:MAG: alpha/beta hydrolase [Polyangiaceae bacterium]|nr:alpha/beta hydrolase [Polyangiaceae bacterium]
MREKAFFFGAHGTLFGILTEPNGTRDAVRPAVILLNAGVVHRIGPHRKSVKLARSLADQGFSVFRFDLAGLGDSEPRRDALSFEEGAVSDVKEAMDHLQKMGAATRFLLMGLCSGADMSFQTTCRDERVVGAIMMDGYSYPTPEYHVRRFVQRARTVRSWRAFGLRKARELMHRWKHGPSEKAPLPTGPIRQYVREFPPKERFISDLKHLVGRGVFMHFVYSGGMPEYYNYERQFADALAGVHFGDHVTSEMFPTANHTFTELAEQEALVAAAVKWTVRRFGSAG